MDPSAPPAFNPQWTKNNFIDYSNDNSNRCDYVIAIDKSGSTAITDCNGSSRWSRMQDYAITFAQIAEQRDPDGITIIPFNHTFQIFDNVTSKTVADVFAQNKPSGGTLLAPVLNKVFNDFLKKKKNEEIERLCLLVLSDGRPSDTTQVENEIISFSHKLSSTYDAAILFIQIGYDAEATTWLKKLDDELKGPHKAKFDIVDHKNIDWVESNSIEEALKQAFID